MHPAQQNYQQRVHRHGDGGHRRKHRPFERRPQAPGQARQSGAAHKHLVAQSLHRQTAGGCPQRRVAQSLQSRAPAGAGHTRHARQSQQHEDTQRRVPQRTRFGGNQTQADQAVVTPCQIHPLRGPRPNHLCQRQRQHGQVHPAAAHHQSAKGHRHGQRQRHARGQSRRQTRAPVQVRERCAISAQRKKRRMAKADQAAQSHHPLQAQAKQHHHHHVFGQAAAVIALPPGQQRQAHKDRHQQRPAPARDRPERKHRHAFALLGMGGRPGQTLRPPNQHHRHRQKHQHQGRLREKAQAQGVDHADQHRRHKSPANAAKAARDHDHKGLDHHVHVHLQMCGLARQLQRPGQARQAAAQHHHTQHERRGVHAQRGEHLAVLCGRLHALPPQGAREQKVQAQPDQRPQHQSEQLPGREIRLAQLDRALEARKARREHLFRAKEPAHRVVQRQGQAEGGHQLVQLRRVAHALEQRDFGHGPEQGGHTRAHQDHRAVAPGAVRHVGPPVCHRMRRPQSAQHEEAAMRKVDDPGHAKNQRQPGGHQEQGGGVAQAIEQLQRQCVESQTRPLSL